MLTTTPKGYLIVDLKFVSRGADDELASKQDDPNFQLLGSSSDHNRKLQLWFAPATGFFYVATAAEAHGYCRIWSHSPRHTDRKKNKKQHDLYERKLIS